MPLAIDNINHISYSQYGEDLILYRLLMNVSKGQYIDVGGNDPKKLSNTFKFYKLGWHGLIFEPNPKRARQFQKKRPKDTVLQYALADYDGTIDYFECIGTINNSNPYENMDVMSTTSKEELEHFKSLGYRFTHSVVRCYRMDTVLSQYPEYRNNQTSIVSIDVEGAESKVIAGINFDSFSPTILIIEALEHKTCKDVSSRWKHFIPKYYTELYRPKCLNYIFVRNDIFIPKDLR